MVTLTGFADEISPHLEEQMNVLESEGISHIEFRGVNEKKCAQADGRRIETGQGAAQFA